MVKQYDGTWGCSECDFVTKYQATLTNHVEAKHLQSDGYSCQYCNKFCPTKNALKCHIYQRHSQKNNKSFWNGPSQILYFTNE
jgi:MinD superfamily P-loop ATPase